MYIYIHCLLAGRIFNHKLLSGLGCIVYSQKLLLSMLDNHCIHCNEQILRDGDEEQPLSSYDFVYLPIDFK